MYITSSDRDECQADVGVGGWRGCSCPSCRARSMAFGSSSVDDDSRDAWDFEFQTFSDPWDGLGERLLEVAVPRPETVTIKFSEILCESKKAWKIITMEGCITWFPKSVCYLNNVKKELTTTKSFYDFKLKKDTAPQNPVAPTESCPYCGAAWGCRCAGAPSRGLPTREFALAFARKATAEKAKSQIEDFIREHKV